MQWRECKYNGVATMKNNAIMSLKLRNKIFVYASNSDSGYMSKVIKLRVSKRYLYTSYSYYLKGESKPSAH